MVTGECLVNVIARFVHRNFGFVKICFDVTLVLISCTLSLLFAGHILLEVFYSKNIAATSVASA